MIVFRYFIKIALRHKWMIISYAAIFFILSVLNGTNTEGKEISFEETRLDIGVVDNSNSELSEGLIDYLGQNNNIVKMNDDIDSMKEKIFLEVIEGAIIIPEDFEKRVIDRKESLEIVKDDMRLSSFQIESEVNKYLIFANASGDDGDFQLDNVNSALEKQVKVEVLEEGNVQNQSASTWFKFYFNFTGYVIIAIYIAVIGLVMTEFKDENIESRTKISSKKFINYNSELYLGQISIGVFISAIFIIGSLVLKGKHIGEVDFTKYLINVGVFSFSILCFTFLINSLTRSRFIINGLSTVASLGTAFISGVMVPQEFLSEKVLSIAKFFPTYYFVKVNETRLNSIFDVSYELGMQILFGIAFVLVGLYFSKSKQKT